MDGPTTTLTVVLVALVVWIGVLVGVLLSMTSCCSEATKQRRRGERRRRSSSSSSSSSSDSEGPVPVVIPNVYGVSPDPQATAIVNNTNTNATPPFVKQIFGPLSDLPVSPLVNPNYVTATFSGSYNRVLSISQSYLTTAGSPPLQVPNGGTLDVILPGVTSSVVQSVVLTGISMTPTVLSVVSNVTTDGWNQAFVAITDGVNSSTVMLITETAPGSGSYDGSEPSTTTLNGGVIQDMRVSPDNRSLVVVTNAQSPDPNFALYDISTPGVFNQLALGSTQAAMYGSGSPATTNNLTAVSAAFTPDNLYVLVALTSGTGPDRILRVLNALGVPGPGPIPAGVAFSSIATSGSPRQVAVKIICSGLNYFVGRRGTDLMDVGLWADPGFLTVPPGTVNGLGTGVIDLQNAPHAGTTNSTFIALYHSGYNSGSNYLQFNSSLSIVNFVTLLTPATRVSFSRDGQKCYLSTNDNRTYVWEQDMFNSTPPVQVPGTELNTWYVTAVSSADYGASF